MTVLSTSRGLVAVVAADFSDPTNERIILLSAAGLAVVGVTLLVGTILWWRRGRQEHPSLAPLEVMGSRAWVKAPEGDRYRRLERARRRVPGPAPDELERSEPVDLQALVRSVPQAFDDLREPGAIAGDDLAWLLVAAVPDGSVAEASVVQPVVGAAPLDAAPVESASASPNGAVVPAVAPDPDATLYAAERPQIPLTEPEGAGEAPSVTGNGADAEVLASAHHDQS